jgi:transcriptional regulator with XRE-family HTH domain
MTTHPNDQNNFAQALRRIRKARGIPQEAFALESSRTYVSTLERGLKSPTLNKVDELARVLSVHPLTLLMAAYSGGSDATVAKAFKELKEISQLGA